MSKNSSKNLANKGPNPNTKTPLEGYEDLVFFKISFQLLIYMLEIILTMMISDMARRTLKKIMCCIIINLTG